MGVSKVSGIAEHPYIRPNTEQNFEAVYNGMLDNFQRRNVTMLEFTDFIESYTSSIVQIYRNP